MRETPTAGQRLGESAMPGCVDTENWDNHSGRRCSDYALEQWCVRGAFARGAEWTGGSQFNNPETNCCICGKVKASGGPYPWADSGPAAVPNLTPDVSGDAASALAASIAVEPRSETIEEAEEEDPETMRDERLRALVKQRATSCAALAPSRADNFLLVYPRLPRVGNGLLCAVLSACSQRPLACAGASMPTDPTMCPLGADWRYTDVGQLVGMAVYPAQDSPPAASQYI